LTVEGWEDVKKYFGDWKAAVSLTVEDVSLQIKNFMQNTTFASYSTFWNASLYGRKLVEMVGTSIYEWSGRVAEYVNYVRGLLSSLRDIISSYQDQLDQMRGNDLAILDRWYQKEIASLKQKYGEELQASSEYQQALTLLQELYAEKRKKLLDQEKEETKKFYQDIKNMQEVSGGESGSGTDGGGSASSVKPVNPEDIMLNPRYNPLQKWSENLKQNVQSAVDSITKAFGEGVSIGPKELKVQKEFNLTAKVELPSLDAAYTRDWFKTQFWPLFAKELELKGIKL
jgi:hypothetical protein